MTVAAVNLWGRRIGAVSIEPGDVAAAFQYEPDFVASGIQPSPVRMPLRERPYRFPELAPETFHGLPGMLADSLPDKFGSALIDSWLASRGRDRESFDVVERLCYIGDRGMGALEFAPASGPDDDASSTLRVDQLAELASQVLTDRERFAVSLGDSGEDAAMRSILRVGTSAGGARAKAIIAWNPTTHEVHSGQVATGDGFEYWLLKFDGVIGNRDREREDPQGFGAIEYAYALMAAAAEVTMSDCRLFEENGRRHFMTKRFDRTEDGAKLHMQTFGALDHLDYNVAGGSSYEQVFQLMRRLALPIEQIEQQFVRTTFNIVARNQDDHVKNIAFLMDRAGTWSLAPAYDVTYAYQPDGLWTSTHQMTFNAKRDGFTRDDFRDVARFAGLRRDFGDETLERVTEVVAKWRDFAADAAVDEAQVEGIASGLRLDLS